MQRLESYAQTDSAYHQKVKTRLLITFLALAIAFAMIASVLRFSGAEGLLMSDVLWWITASVLLALWAVHDHGDRVAGELDWDQMLFVFWPLTLLLWLVKTRYVKGLVGYLGCCLLVVLPSVVPWLLA
jgi:hypothetical protein